MSSSKQVLKSIIQSDQDEGKNTFLGAKLGLYILLVLTIIHTFYGGCLGLLLITHPFGTIIFTPLSNSDLMDL